MSACKTGCGTELDAYTAHFCKTCDARFRDSPEWRRFTSEAASHKERASAIVDFCNRVRAERRPEVPREP